MYWLREEKENIILDFILVLFAPYKNLTENISEVWLLEFQAVRFILSNK